MELQLRAVAHEDAPRIFALHEATSPQDEARDWKAWETRWRWAHVENPWAAEGVPVGIVAEQGGKLVGHLGLTPVPLRRGAHRFVGQTSEGFLVDPAVQGQGLGRKLSQRAWDDPAVPVPVTFTATSTSAHLFEKFDALRAPLDLSQTRLCVLRGSALAARLASGSGAASRVLGLPGARLLLGGVASAAFSLARAPLRAPKDWKLTPLDGSDPAIAALVDRATGDTTLAVDIDGRYLAWRYLDAPEPARQSYRLLGVRDSDDRLLALAVVEERPHPEWGGTFATLMEWVAPPEHRAGALAQLLAEGRARGWDVLRAPYLSPAWDRLCAKRGFIREAISETHTLVKAVPPLEDANDWSGDADAYEIGMGCRW